MIVVDASAIVEVLVARRPASELIDVIREDLAAPHLIDVEVMSVLRGLSLAGKLDDFGAASARHNFMSLAIDRHGFEPYAERVWALRHGLTSYDASYVALAEALDVELVTCDKKLLAPSHRARVRFVPAAR
ncbi:type II toxin-antitoxin system VapC family toxin [Gryllotalpicola koreensis]|uniref:Ribonuclease VapC n=1 Tax=Gryllotalpicola koreensis TaxID=993086 RepID=A0ABP8A3V4_9MICO